jgi:ABC-type uncharacterized transport system substrate-binding protein
VDGLRQGLRDYGWAEGQNIAIEYRFFERNEQAQGLAAELVQARVELLFAAGSTGALAAKNVTDMLPVVFAAVSPSAWADDPSGRSSAGDGVDQLKPISGRRL